MSPIEFDDIICRALLRMSDTHAEMLSCLWGVWPEKYPRDDYRKYQRKYNKYHFFLRRFSQYYTRTPNQVVDLQSGVKDEPCK